VRVEFASEAGTQRNLSDLAKRYEQTRTYGSRSSTDRSIHRLGDARKKAGNSRYQYSIAGVGECKVVGLTIYIKDVQLHGWNTVYR